LQFTLYLCGAINKSLGLDSGLLFDNYLTYKIAISLGNKISIALHILGQIDQINY